MIKTLLVYLFVLSAHQICFASGEWSERGNGGDVVVCAAKGSHVFLDVYEMRTRYDLKLKLSAIPARSFPFIVGPEELIQMAQAKLGGNLAVLDRSLLYHMVVVLQNFNNDTWYMRNIQLPEIDDSGSVRLPPGCELKQLIIQRPTPTEKNSYVIAIDLWKKMRYDSRLAAILHEVIYHVALTKNPKIKDSEKIRYFNALILSDRLKNFTPHQYKELYKKTFELK